VDGGKNCSCAGQVQHTKHVISTCGQGTCLVAFLSSSFNRNSPLTAQHNILPPAAYCITSSAAEMRLLHMTASLLLADESLCYTMPPWYHPSQMCDRVCVTS
jgi:hypothetical protein